MSSDDHISVRDWRRKSPLRLRATKKFDIHWCWIKCSRCPRTRKEIGRRLDHQGGIIRSVEPPGRQRHRWRTCDNATTINLTKP